MVHNMKTKEERVIDIESQAAAIAFSPAGDKLAVAYNKSIGLYAADTGEKIHTFDGHTTATTCVVFSTDGRYLVSGSAYSEKAVRVWHIESRQCALELSTTVPFAIKSVSVATDFSYICSLLDNNNLLDSWSVSKQTETQDILSTKTDSSRNDSGLTSSLFKSIPLLMPEKAVAVRFIDGTRSRSSTIVMVVFDARLQFYDLATKYLLESLTFKRPIASDVGLSPDGTEMAVCFQDQAWVGVYSLRVAPDPVTKNTDVTCKLTQEYKLHGGATRLNAVSYLDARLLVAVDARSAMMWSTKSPRYNFVPIIDTSKLNSAWLAMSPDGNWIVEGPQKSVRAKSSTFELKHCENYNESRLSLSLAGTHPVFHPSEPYLMLLTDSKLPEIKIINLSQLDDTVARSFPDRPIISLDVVEYSDQQVPIRFDAGVDKTRIAFRPPYALTFSPNGKLFAWVTWAAFDSALEYFIIVHDWADPASCKYQIGVGRDRVRSISFSTGGDRLIMYSASFHATVWYLASPTPTAMFSLRAKCSAACFLSDSSLFELAYGDDAGTLVLAPTLKELRASQMRTRDGHLAPTKVVRLQLSQHQITQIDPIVARQGTLLIVQTAKEVFLVDLQRGIWQNFDTNKACLSSKTGALALLDKERPRVNLLTSDHIAQTIFTLCSAMSNDATPCKDVVDAIKTGCLSVDAVYLWQATDLGRTSTVKAGIALLALLCEISDDKYAELLKDPFFDRMIIRYFKDNPEHYRSAYAFAAHKKLLSELNVLTARISSKFGCHLTGAVDFEKNEEAYTAKIHQETDVISDAFPQICRRVPAAAINILQTLVLELPPTAKGNEGEHTFAHDSIFSFNLPGDTKDEVPVKHKVFLLPDVVNREYWRNSGRKGTLESIVDNNVIDAFRTPAARAILDYRFKQVANLFYSELFVFLFYLSLATAFSNWIASDDISLSLAEKYSGPTGAAYEIIGIIILIINAWFILCEFLEARSAGLSVYAFSIWNLIDLSCYGLVIATAVLHCQRRQEQWATAAVAILIIWMKILEYCRGMDGFGLFVAVVLQITWEIRYFMCVWLIIVMGSANAYLVLFKSQSEAGFWVNLGTAFVSMYYGIVSGSLAPNLRGAAFQPQDTQLYNLQLVVYVAVVFIANMLLLNMLIALMNSVFNDVTAKADVYQRMQKADLVLEIERVNLPMARAQDWYANHQYMSPVTEVVVALRRFVFRKLLTVICLLPVFVIYLPVTLVCGAIKTPMKDSRTRRVLNQFRIVLRKVSFTVGMTCRQIDWVVSLLDVTAPFRRSLGSLKLQDSRWLHVRAPRAGEFWDKDEAVEHKVEPVQEQLKVDEDEKQRKEEGDQMALKQQQDLQSRVESLQSELKDLKSMMQLFLKEAKRSSEA